MSSIIDTIIFDVGGVLLPNYNDYIKNDISRALGVSLTDVENAWNKLIPSRLGKGEITEDKFWEEFKKIIKYSPKIEGNDLLVREMKKRYAPFASVGDIVKSLAEDGYKLAVISDTIKAHADYQTERGLFDDFSVKIFSNEVKIRKPDPQIFQIALRQLNSVPENTVYIDDIPGHVKAAEKLGIKGIVFNNDNQLKADLKSLGIEIKISADKKSKEKGVYALLLTKDNNVLLQERNINSDIKNSGKITMFGGALDDNEELLDGLKRELLEELELFIDDYKIEKFKVYKKTIKLDGLNHLVHVWLIYNVEPNNLKLHEGESILCDDPRLLINNPKITRITKLVLHDLINKLNFNNKKYNNLTIK